MLKTIGNTPLIKIQYQYKQKTNYIYAKLESYNLTGSIKDRTAYYIITKAKERGTLKEGMPIIEATSGNTGISLSALGKYYHHPVYIFMPNWVSKERIQLMKSYGAQVTTFSHEQGGFKRCIQEAQKLARKTNGFLANQFANKDNLLAQYETTGQEIINQVPEDIGGFVSGVGTGGTLMGIGKKIRRNYPEAKVVAIEPDSMPLISKNRIFGPHKIEGIGDDFIPALIDKNEIDKVILVHDMDAINMSRRLSAELGLGVGISSGANFLGCILLQDEIKVPVVTVFADDNKKYLSTDLSKPMDENNKYISNQVKLITYEVC
ncbi:MAG: cysteine synthase family protein [Clostridia bacterium]|nr:cysteine synthase family protein [Clostridia bacterium]MCI9413007.1 cysteine synthase family protein [Clostridia bacterium]